MMLGTLWVQLQPFYLFSWDLFESCIYIYISIFLLRKKVFKMNFIEGDEWTSFVALKKRSVWYEFSQKRSQPFKKNIKF